MGTDEHPPNSILQDETRVRWGFLEDEPDACAVVTQRMELVYLNRAGEGLTGSAEWFGRRCFEMIPVENDNCTAWDCPPLRSLIETKEIAYCEETVRLGDEANLRLGTVVVPFGREFDDHAAGLLAFRRRIEIGDDKSFQEELVRYGEKLRDLVTEHLG